MRQEISTDSAPEALGPYSQAVKAGQFLFLSGQVPIDPATGELVQGGTGPQTHQVLKNIAAVLGAANISLDHVVRTTVFLLDMNDFAEMNDVYQKYFNSPAPARAAVQVARLPKNARVEIDATALFE